MLSELKQGKGGKVGSLVFVFVQFCISVFERGQAMLDLLLKLCEPCRSLTSCQTTPARKFKPILDENAIDQRKGEIQIKISINPNIIKFVGNTQNS